jgi:diguanylate cyclase (GGDEF)-like protein/PAS domain S-box-containing protein
VPLIVIIDDQVTNQSIFSKLAGSIEEGTTVRAFGDPEKALDWVRDNTPDLVITDYKMPEMDGAEFIRRFRELPAAAEVPVIVITIYEERSFRLRALEAGATDFLASPIDPHEFVTRARNLLRLRKQQLLLERKLQYSERSREEALRDSSERLAQVIDTVPAMISATDRQGRVIFGNAYHTLLTGGDPGPGGEPFGRGISGESGGRHRALDRKVFETNMPLPSYEEEILDRNGTRRVFLTTKSPLRDRSNGVVAVLTTAIDITERKQAETHLFYMAHHDALTDLPNRTLLRSRLNRSIARARRGDSSFALHLIDLDGFKAINDVLGHSTGDRFLKLVAERLRAVAGERDTVARLGGDEFAILQNRLTCAQDAADLAIQVIDVIGEPQIVGGERLHCTASIGVTLHPSDGGDADQLLKNADLAMYRAKAEGGSGYRFYASDMNTRARAAAALDVAMREAIEQRQFALYYEPQVDVRSGQILGAEALLRWRRPERGVVEPSDFLARAEENGLIVPINEWVLREACREAKSWQCIGQPPLRVSVNLSPIQFRRQSVPLLVTKILGEIGLEPWRLDLELTENIVLQDAEAVARDLQQLRDLGVKISIDDFGTGYSSLTYVKQFPIDRLKIDQCFIRDLARDPNDAVIVRAIVSLGHSLDLDVVAEGVETREQMLLLRSEGCYEMQGYYLAKPMPAEEFVALLAGQRNVALTA